MLLRKMWRYKKFNTLKQQNEQFWQIFYHKLNMHQDRTIWLFKLICNKRSSVELMLDLQMAKSQEFQQFLVLWRLYAAYAIIIQRVPQRNVDPDLLCWQDVAYNANELEQYPFTSIESWSPRNSIDELFNLSTSIARDTQFMNT